MVVLPLYLRILFLCVCSPPHYGRKKRGQTLKFSNTQNSSLHQANRKHGYYYISPRGWVALYLPSQFCELQPQRKKIIKMQKTCETKTARFRQHDEQMGIPPSKVFDLKPDQRLLLEWDVGGWDLPQPSFPRLHMAFTRTKPGNTFIFPFPDIDGSPLWGPRSPVRWGNWGALGLRENPGPQT